MLNMLFGKGKLRSKLKMNIDSFIGGKSIIAFVTKIMPEINVRIIAIFDSLFRPNILFFEKILDRAICSAPNVRKVVNVRLLYKTVLWISLKVVSAQKPWSMSSEVRPKIDVTKNIVLMARQNSSIKFGFLILCFLAWFVYGILEITIPIPDKRTKNIWSLETYPVI